MKQNDSTLITNINPHAAATEKANSVVLDQVAISAPDFGNYGLKPSPIFVMHGGVK